MTFSFKVIKRPPPANVQITAIKHEIVKSVTTVAKQHVAERRRITDRFSHKPEWEYRINVHATGLQLVILLKNASQKVGKVTMATLLMWLFETGTKAHIIRAKNGRALSFMGGSYDRITLRSGTGSGSGTVSGGQPTVRRVVNHPGFKPSPAFRNINFKLGGALSRAFKLGIGNGLRKR